MSFLVALWLLGLDIDMRAIIANLFWPFGFVLWGVLICLFVRWYTRHEKAMQQPKQEPVDTEPAGIETFDAEYYELYQTGLWLLQHSTEAPYDDL